MQKFLSAVMLAFLLASCAPSTVEIPNTANPIQNVENSGTTLNVNRPLDAPEWIETDINGVDVGVWLPAGWHYDDTSGLTLIERMSSVETGAPANGIIFYFFVPELDGILDVSSEHDNLAYAALHEVSRTPALTGSAEITRPVKLTWGEVHAAYYTYTAPGDARGWVIAFAVPDHDQILVANITAPHGEISRLRNLVSPIFSDLRINRERLGAPLSAEIEALLDAEAREAG